MNELDFLRQENRKLRDQLDHAQKLITTPVRNMTELELRVQEQEETIRSLEKELIEVFRQKAKLLEKLETLENKQCQQ